jgi:GntR family transcriptional regulator
MLIDRQNPTPLFMQISAAFQRQIERGELTPGEAIASERELAEQLKVSRMTVRAAIDVLVRDGLLYRQHGRSTIVANSKINRSGTGFMSFSEDMRARGLTPRSEIRRLFVEVAPASIAAQLNLPAGASVIHLERVRYADEHPVALERVYLPYERFRELANLRDELAAGSLYTLLEARFDCRPSYAEETLEAVALNAEEAALLNVARQSPALLAHRVTRDERGDSIETVQTLYRGDRYRMVFARSR